MRWFHYFPHYRSFKTPFLFVFNIAAVLCFTSSCQYFELIQFVQTQTIDKDFIYSHEMDIDEWCAWTVSSTCGCRLMSFFAKENYQILNCSCERINVFTATLYKGPAIVSSDILADPSSPLNSWASCEPWFGCHCNYIVTQRQRANKICKREREREFTGKGGLEEKGAVQTVCMIA